MFVGRRFGTPVGSETSAYKHNTRGNNPKRTKLVKCSDITFHLQSYCAGHTNEVPEHSTAVFIVK